MEQNIESQPNTPVSPDGGAIENSDKKKSKPPVLVIIFAILALAGISFGVYGLFFKPSPVCSCPNCVTEKLEEPSEEPKEEPDDPEKQNSSSSSKTSGYAPTPDNAYRTFENVIGSKHEDYYNTYELRSGKQIWGYDNSNELKTYYLNCSSSSCNIIEENGEIYATIDNFQNKIRDYYFIMFGQAAGSEKIFFVMDDGSVEYMPVSAALTENKIESYGKIDGLKNIIKIHQIEVSSFGYDKGLIGRGAGAIAEDVDGNFYDLYNL